MKRIDAAGARELGDLVIANLPCPVADKARYAETTSVAARLRFVLALLDAHAPPA